MNKFYTLVAALLVVTCTSMVKADGLQEAASAVTETAVKAANSVAAGVQEGVAKAAAPAAAPSLATKIAEAEAKVQARQMEAARRAGLSFFEARGEDVSKVWGATKWGALQVGRGVSNADGYVGAAIAIPTGYVAGTAFSAATTCAESAASIK